MLSKIINIGKTPILYFAFPYEKIDPLPFQLQIFDFDTSKEVGKPIRYGLAQLELNLAHAGRRTARGRIKFRDAGNPLRRLRR